MRELPGGTVTFMLADVEGSTPLWDDAPDAMSGSMERLNVIADEVIERHRGARPLEQGEGDSFVAAFHRGSDAVACSLDLQLALGKEPWEGPALTVRIGLHTGEARLGEDGQNYSGEAMHRCARLRSLGHGGQTLLSRSTYEIVADSLADGVTLRDLGPHHLRGLQRPEHVWQLGHPDLPDTFPPLRSIEAMPNNLTSQLTSFVGRENEMAEVTSLLDEHRVVTLTGSGGVGKTRLAVEVAATLLDRYPDGVWLVDLSSTNDPDLVVKVVSSAARVTEATTRSAIDQLTFELKDKHTLIVLDNCEHLLDAAAVMTEGVVRSCNHVAFLATSREPLGITGEVAWRVPSLAVPDGAETLADTDAVHLFADRARATRPNFKVNDANAVAIAEICRRLDGIPLAIELAAARVRVLTPQQIASGLKDRFQLLTGGGPRALPRQRTLEASVDWSYNLLPEDERVLLRRSSVFAGSFTLDAAEAVCADDGGDAYRVLDLLSSLVDRSLILMDDEGAEARYRLLETIRQYASQRLVDAGEGHEIGTRHLRYYLEAATRIEYLDTDVDLRDLVAAFEVDGDNFRAAFDWAIGAGAANDGLELANRLAPAWGVRNQREGVERLRRALEQDGLDPTTRGYGLVWLSYLMGFGGQSAPLAREAVDVARALGDRFMEGRAQASLSMAILYLDPPAAEAACEAAVALGQENNDPWASFHGHLFLGWLALMHADSVRADAEFEQAINAATGSGIGQAGRAWALIFRGATVANIGTLPDALRILDDAHEIIERSHIDAMLGLSLVLRGGVAFCHGEFEAGRRLVGEAERTLVRTSSGNTFTPLYRSMIAMFDGDLDEAERQIDIHNTMVSVAGFTWMNVQGLATKAVIRLARGDIEGARPVADEALSQQGVEEIPGALTMALLARGLVARADGDLGAADRFLRDALTAAATSEVKVHVADALRALGGLAASSGRFEEGARLIGAGDRVATDAGWAISQLFPFAENDVTAVRQEIGDAALEEAFAAGAAMSTDEIVAYAQRGRGPRDRPAAGWDSLSPRELDVARLVAQGLTNPEIGERLFLSKRTVQTHLSHIFAKVGVSSRAELASEATRRSL